MTTHFEAPEDRGVRLIVTGWRDLMQIPGRFRAAYGDITIRVAASRM